jgi:cellobiose phosphorylase
MGSRGGSPRSTPRSRPAAGTASEWYVRAFREDGSVIGTRRDPEGSIFLNPQSWAVLSGAATGERARRAMDSVHERLATPYGVMLCDPPFVKTDVAVVRAVLFNPGMKENGSSSATRRAGR